MFAPDAPSPASRDDFLKQQFLINMTIFQQKKYGGDSCRGKKIAL